MNPRLNVMHAGFLTTFRATIPSDGARPFAMLMPIVLFAVLISGCATRSISGGAIDMVSRDNNAVSHGDFSRAYPGTTMTIDIDRRTYMGEIEPTAPNATFGFEHLYGPGRYASGSSDMPSRNTYYRAVLSSTDHYVLRCDLIRHEGKWRDGLCVDNFGKIYDVIANHP